MLKLSLLSLAAGVLVGVIYSLLGVRSPAPPLVALVGLAGILIGERVVPVVKRMADKPELVRFLREDCSEHGLGVPPIDKSRDT